VVRGRRTTADLDRHHRPEPGVPDPLDGRVLRGPASDLGGVGALPLEPHVERAQAAQRKPRLHGAGDSTVDEAPTLQRDVEVFTLGHRDAEEDVAVAGEVLGGRVDDNVGAEV
jgi:hypothetical protein